jgi:hypothetical protein
MAYRPDPRNPDAVEAFSAYDDATSEAMYVKTEGVPFDCSGKFGHFLDAACVWFDGGGLELKVANKTSVVGRLFYLVGMKIRSLTMELKNG